MSEQEEHAIQLVNNYLEKQGINTKISLSDTSWQEGIRLCSEAIQYGKVLRRAEQYDEGLALAEASHTIENFFRTKRSLDLNTQPPLLQTMYNLYNNTSPTLTSIVNDKETTLPASTNNPKINRP